MRVVLVAVAAVVLAGCASPSGNMRIGSEQPYTSLEAQRAAVRGVTEARELPPGAKVLGPVDASRCHRYQGDIEPSEEQLLSDLKAAAYGRGADGVTGVSVVRESGLLRNCWYIWTARATMFVKAQP
jgi:hypothetical protein